MGTCGAQKTRFGGVAPRATIKGDNPRNPPKSPTKWNRLKATWGPKNKGVGGQGQTPKDQGFPIWPEPKRGPKSKAIKSGPKCENEQ